ncbi:hypothetical protein GCM10022217_13420 [Chryseobacterium ginsenosidimutans]|uniref:hypothetical protein n=1 Tax=Chryseobacterium ginsenosidimutans TaxID=687846 RepID=UPI0031D393BC
MKKDKILITIGFFTSLLAYAQKTNEYKFLASDTNKNKIYEKFERRDGNKVCIWNKIEETFENDPSTEFTEYYLQINCDTKTSVLKKLIIHWRDGNIEKHDDPSNKEVSITDSKSIPGLLYQNHCIK